MKKRRGQFYGQSRQDITRDQKLVKGLNEVKMQLDYSEATFVEIIADQVEHGMSLTKDQREKAEEILGSF